MNTPPIPPQDPPDLADEVRRLLYLHRGHWTAVAGATDVSHSWLSKFARGTIRNPGYATLKRLHEYLSRVPPPLQALPPTTRMARPAEVV